MSHKPTIEQQQVIDTAATGTDLTIEAGAGAGKTSTLKMLAANTRGRGIYLAYNKAIATEAAASFPRTVTCKTAHSFAFGAVGRQYAHRLNGPRIPAREAAKIMRINEPIKVGEIMLAPQQIARLVAETVQSFCYSAADRIERMNVPLVNGLDRPGQAELARYIVPLAQKAWDVDLTQLNGRLRFTHDMYLKMWALSKPKLSADYVLLDEAQDSNPAVSGIVTGQDAQRILVGDRCQAIYGWRGAVDAMATFPGKRLYLSQSFRFGPVVADEANKWLSVLNAPLRLSGFDQIDSRLGQLGSDADAILCRSNGGALKQAMDALGAGRRTALVGGGADIRRLAEAAMQLQNGLPTDHPELFAFATWREVQEYVEHDAAGQDLKVFVRLVDRHGPATLIRTCDALVDERHAQIVISTAHKAKGREWERVTIDGDFQEPRSSSEDQPPSIARDEAMLAYVAVTRAQHVLDREGVAWVDRWIGGPPAQLPVSRQLPGARPDPVVEGWVGAAVREHPDAVLPDVPDAFEEQPVRQASFPPAPRRPCLDCDHLDTFHRPGKNGRTKCSASSCGCKQLVRPAASVAA